MSSSALLVRLSPRPHERLKEGPPRTRRSANRGEPPTSCDSFVISPGAGVGGFVGNNWLSTKGGGGERASKLTPTLSLPTGIAFEFLPGVFDGLGRLGVHAQATLLDVAQDAIVTTNGDTVESNVATSIYFGGSVGLLLGTPSRAVLVGANGGFAPALRINTEETDDFRAWRFGAFVGAYALFIDFN